MSWWGCFFALVAWHQQLCIIFQLQFDAFPVEDETSMFNFIPHQDYFNKSTYTPISCSNVETNLMCWIYTSNVELPIMTRFIIQIYALALHCLLNLLGKTHLMYQCSLILHSTQKAIASRTYYTLHYTLYLLLYHNKLYLKAV